LAKLSIIEGYYTAVTVIAIAIAIAIAIGIAIAIATATAIAIAIDTYIATAIAIAISNKEWNGCYSAVFFHERSQVCSMCKKRYHFPSILTLSSEEHPEVYNRKTERFYHVVSASFPGAGRSTNTHYLCLARYAELRAS
jgi:hypothetical protein